MRAITRLFLACLAVTSLVAVACAQPYTLNPSGATVDWHVATEWDALIGSPTFSPGTAAGDQTAVCLWDASNVEVVVDEDLTVASLAIAPLLGPATMSLSGSVTFTASTLLSAAGLVGAEVHITGTGSETLAGDLMTLGPEVYVSDVTISESLVGVLTTVGDVTLTDVTLDIAVVSAGPLSLEGNTVLQSDSLSTDGEVTSTIAIPTGATMVVEAPTFTFNDGISVSGAVNHVPGGTLVFSGDGDFVLEAGAVLDTGLSTVLDLDSGAVLECAGCTMAVANLAVTGADPAAALQFTGSPSQIDASGAIDISVPIELNGGDLDIVLATPAASALNGDVTLGDGTTLSLGATVPLASVTLDTGAFTAGAGSTISVDDVEVVIGDTYTAVVPNLAVNDGGELTVGGTLTVGDGATLGDGPITVGAGGVLSLPATTAFTGLGPAPVVTVEGTGNLITEGWTGDADVTVDAAGMLTVGGAADVAIAGLTLSPGATLAVDAPLVDLDNAGAALALDGAIISGTGTVAFPNGGFTTVDAPQTTITVPTVVSDGVSAVKNLAAATTTIEVAGGSLEFGGIGSTVGSVVVDAPATLSLSTVDVGFTPTTIGGLLDLSAVGASVEVVMSSDDTLPITVATYGSVAGAPMVTVTDTGLNPAGFDCTADLGLTALVVDCVVVTTVAPSLVYTLTPSAAMVDWDVAAEWEFLGSAPLFAPGTATGDQTAVCLWTAGDVVVAVDEDLTVSALTITPLLASTTMTMSGGVTLTANAALAAAGLVGAEVYITGTGSETLAGNLITLGPEVYVSDVTISESLVGVLTTVGDVTLTDVTLDIAVVSAGPLSLEGNTVLQSDSLSTDGEVTSTIAIPTGATMVVEAPTFTFNDGISVSGAVNHVPGGTLVFSGDGDFVLEAGAVLDTGLSTVLDLDSGAVLECAGCTMAVANLAVTGADPAAALQFTGSPSQIDASGAIDISVPIELNGGDLDIVLATPAASALNGDVTLGDGTTLSLGATVPLASVTLDTGAFTAGAGSTISVDDVEVVIGDTYTAVVPNLAVNDGGELTVGGTLTVGDGATLGDGPITVGAGGVLSLPATTAFTGLGPAPVVTVEGTGNLITEGWTGDADVTVDAGGMLTVGGGADVAIAGLTLSPGATLVVDAPLVDLDNAGAALALDGATISGMGTVAFPNGGFTTVDAPQTTITVPTVVSDGVSAVENLAAATTTIEVAGGSLEFGGIGSTVGSVVVDAPATLSLSTVDVGFTPTTIGGLLDLSAAGASVEVVMSSDDTLPITVATYGSVAGAPTVTVTDTGVSAAGFECTADLGVTALVVDCVPVTTVAPSTVAPTMAPTSAPTTVAPTDAPTDAPTTVAPTMAPTSAPTSVAPTMAPTTAPTDAPTVAPTTVAPTMAPTSAPTTVAPTTAPTGAPTDSPTDAPTSAPVDDSTTDAPTATATTAGPTTGEPVTAAPADNTETNAQAASNTVASQLQTLFGTETSGAAWGISAALLAAFLALLACLCLVICCCCCGGRRTREQSKDVEEGIVLAAAAPLVPSSSSSASSTTVSSTTSSSTTSFSSTSSSSSSMTVVKAAVVASPVATTTVATGAQANNGGGARISRVRRKRVRTVVTSPADVSLN